MRHRLRLFSVLSILFAVAASLLFVAPAEAAKRPRLSAYVAPYAVDQGQPTYAVVSATRARAGQTVKIQQLKGSTWGFVASGKLRKNGKSLEARIGFVPTQTTGYRAYLPRTKHSKAAAAPLAFAVNPATSRALRFDLTGAVALAVAGGTSSPRARATSAPTPADSNLDVVLADGSLRDAVTSGRAQIASAQITSNGRVFVVFASTVNLLDPSSGGPTMCLLAEIDRASGVPTCIYSVQSGAIWVGTPVQLDAAGAVYFRGYSDTGSGSVVVKRYANGHLTDLVGDNTRIDRFQVLSSGAVLLAGSTLSTGSSWTRLLKTDGGLTTLYAYQVWGNLFPDGDFYFIESSCDGPGGLRRFDSSTLQLAPTLLLRSNPSPGSVLSDRCDGQRSPYYNALSGGTFYATPDGQVISSWFIDNGQKALQVGRVFPTPPGDGATTQCNPDAGFVDCRDDGYVLQTGVFSQRMTLSAYAKTWIAYAGIDQGLDKIVAFDLDTWAFTTLTVPGDIELYHLAAAGDDVLFQGLRLSDNKIVEGRIDGATHQVKVLGTTTSRWLDLQGF